MVKWISPKLLMGLSESEFLIVHDPYFSPDLQSIKTLGDSFAPALTLKVTFLIIWTSGLLYQNICTDTCVNCEKVAHGNVKDILDISISKEYELFQLLMKSW